MTDEGIHHAIQDIAPVIIVIAMTGATVSVLKALIAAYRNRAVLRAQTELHNKILEKFATAEEFTDYLQSDAGKIFFDNLAKEPATPITKILGSIQKGVILALFGIGFLIISGIFGTSDSRNIMLIIATMTITIGTGFLISSAISHRLAKSWGMLTKKDDYAPPIVKPVTP